MAPPPRVKECAVALTCASRPALPNRFVRSRAPLSARRIGKSVCSRIATAQHARRVAPGARRGGASRSAAAGRRARRRAAHAAERRGPAPAATQPLRRRTGACAGAKRRRGSAAWSAGSACCEPVLDRVHALAAPRHARHFSPGLRRRPIRAARHPPAVRPGLLAGAQLTHLLFCPRCPLL